MLFAGPDCTRSRRECTNVRMTQGFQTEQLDSVICQKGEGPVGEE